MIKFDICIQGNSPAMSRSGLGRWVRVWRDGSKSPLEKRNGEEQIFVSGKIDGDKEFEMLGLENMIDKQFRATEGLWYQAVKRFEGGFDQHRFEEGKWKDTVMNLIGTDLSRKQQYHDQQQEQDQEQEQEQEQVLNRNNQLIRIL